MNEKLLAYLDYIVEHQLRNDAGIRWVRDALQGNVVAWTLAVRGYGRVMRESNSGYLAFRRKWAWTDDKVSKLLASPAGKSMKQHISVVMKNFQAQPGMTEYTLNHGSLRRSLDRQTSSFRKNWSVKILGADLVTKATAELADGAYPDKPTEESAKRFYKFLRRVQLEPVDDPKTPKKKEEITSPTNATPGLSDHGRLSAVDFVVMKRAKKIAGAETSQIPIWRAKRDGVSFESALKDSVKALNDAEGTTLFDGPLPDPPEPWHYTYVPIAEAEESDGAPS